MQDGSPDPPQSRVVCFHSRQAQHRQDRLCTDSQCLASTSFPWPALQFGCSPFPNPACTSPSQNGEGRRENAVTTITLGRGLASPQLRQGETQGSPISRIPQAITYPHAPAHTIVSLPPGSLFGEKLDRRHMHQANCSSLAWSWTLQVSDQAWLSGKFSFPAYG